MIEGDLPESGTVTFIAPHKENGYDESSIDTMVPYLTGAAAVFAKLNSQPDIELGDDGEFGPGKVQKFTVKMDPEARRIIEESGILFRAVV